MQMVNLFPFLKNLQSQLNKKVFTYPRNQKSYATNTKAKETKSKDLISKNSSKYSTNKSTKL